MNIIPLLLILSASFGTDDAQNMWAIPFGPTDVTAISGNGRLTVGVNGHGRISACRWPSPGYFDQLDYATKSKDLPDLGVAPWHGAMWAVRIDGETYWISGDGTGTARQDLVQRDSTVVETIVSLGETDIRVRQQLFVDPSHDIFVARIAIEGAESVPEIYWYQDFAPCTRLIPELPIGDWLLDGENDFATFFDSDIGRLYQFRPGVVTDESWAHASRLVARDASSELWSARFMGSSGEKAGVWIGTSTPNAILGFQCGLVAGSSSAYRAVSRGELGGDRSAVGQCNGALRLAPEMLRDRYTATVFVGFGGGREEVDGNVRYALASGYAKLRRANRLYWRDWLGETGLTLVGNDDELLRRRALITMMQSVDAATGGVVRAPITQPPLALVWARDTAWVSLALDSAGLHDLSGRTLAFLGGAVRREGRRGAPLGSLPGAVYSNGVEGVPHLIVDVDAVSWMLSAFWRHALVLQNSAGTEYLESMWEAVALGGDFLAAWSGESEGYPVHSYQGALGRDGQSDQSLIVLLMGLQSAAHITGALGKAENPEWSARLEDVKAMILYQMVQGKSSWDLERSLPYWLDGIMPRTYPEWPDIEVRVLDEDVPLSGVTFPAAEILSGSQRPTFPSATESAFRFIAATHRIYGRP